MPNEKKANADIKAFGRIWGVIYLGALIHILYFGGFKKCLTVSCNEKTFTTASSDPLIFYSTIFFVVINIFAGLYLGFLLKSEPTQTKEENLKEKLNNF